MLVPTTGLGHELLRSLSHDAIKSTPEYKQGIGGSMTFCNTVGSEGLGASEAVGAWLS